MSAIIFYFSCQGQNVKTLNTLVMEFSGSFTNSYQIVAFSNESGVLSLRKCIRYMYLRKKTKSRYRSKKYFENHKLLNMSLVDKVKKITRSDLSILTRCSRSCAFDYCPYFLKADKNLIQFGITSTD